MHVFAISPQALRRSARRIIQTIRCRIAHTGQASGWSGQWTVSFRSVAAHLREIALGGYRSEIPRTIKRAKEAAVYDAFVEANASG